MKRVFTVYTIAGVLAIFVFQGFQCASPEFTGAKVYIQQRNFAEALPLLENEVKNNPQNEEAWYLLGAIRADMDNYTGMNEAFDQALKISNVHAAEIRGIRFNKWGQHVNAGVNLLERASADSAHFYDESISEFQKSINAWSDTAITYRYLAYAYNNKGDMENALKIFLKAWEMGDEAESAKRAGLIYIRRGDELKSTFENDNKEKIASVNNLQRVRRNTLKNDVQSILGKPDKVTPGPRGSRREDWTYAKYNLKLTIESDKVTVKEVKPPYNPAIDSTSYRNAVAQYANAIEILEEARKKDPADGDVIALLMQGYIGADKINEAISTFQIQVQRDPTNKQNHYVLGVLYRSAGKFEDAIASFQEALKVDSEFTDATYDIGATYYNWGVDVIRMAEERGDNESKEYVEKFEKALPFMEKVSLSADRANSPEIWETLGTIYARLGKTTQATQAFEKADKLRQGN